MNNCHKIKKQVIYVNLFTSITFTRRKKSVIIIINIFHSESAVSVSNPQCFIIILLSSPDTCCPSRLPSRIGVVLCLHKLLYIRRCTSREYEKLFYVVIMADGCPNSIINLVCLCYF